MAKRTCSVPGCINPHRARGWCEMHYQRWMKHGDPLISWMPRLESSLAATHPELAAEADGWDPRSVRKGSEKKLPWVCAKGHRWLACPVHRTAGCPFCEGRRPWPGETDLATTHPELAAEADGWDPTTVSYGSSKKVGWICANGHSWEAKIAERSAGNGCPFCSGRRVSPGETDLATTHPELAAEADGWDPTTVTAGSSRKKPWVCEVGHGWTTTVYNRARKGSGCPYCSGRRALSGETDLATTHPELAAEADGWDPTTVSYGSQKKVSWACPNGHHWDAVVSSRAISGSGCPYCAGQAVVVGQTDLATTHPHLASQADGWDPTTVKAGTNRSASWVCANGHKWEALVSNRALLGNECPYCTGRLAVPGASDLATTHPEMAAQADGWDPRTVKAGTQKRLPWKCAKGHQWVTSPNARTNADTGCPFCSGRRVSPGETDLATTHPELAAEADGWDPTTLVAGSNKKVGWRCAEGHTWRTQVAARAVRGSGCPACAKFGYDPYKAALMYLVERQGEQKFGISNSPDTRLRAHKRSGWVLVESTPMAPGDVVAAAEAQVKRWLKDTIGTLPGTTEAWSTANLEVSSLDELLTRAGVLKPSTWA